MFARTLSALAATALTLGTVAVATPAAAQDQSVFVGYGDLDLTSGRDVAKLKRRIANAAKDACRDGGAAGTLIHSGAAACEQAAIANATRSLDALTLSARASGRQLASRMR